jgi:hypothetical protein
MTMQDMGNGLRKHGFWEFSIGNLITLLGLAAAFIVWWASFSNLPHETAAGLAVLSQNVKEINDKGTFGSQLSIQREQGAISSLDARVSRLESNYASLNEKLVNVQTKLDVIAALLQGDKDHKK